MGEIADMILDGILDEQTGEYIGEAVGYPRTRLKGFYNSMRKNKKHKRNIKHALKGSSVGGLHLVGKELNTKNYGVVKVLEYGGKRGKKRYIITDSNNIKRRIKFQEFVFEEVLGEK